MGFHRILVLAATAAVLAVPGCTSTSTLSTTTTTTGSTTAPTSTVTAPPPSTTPVEEPSSTTTTITHVGGPQIEITSGLRIVSTDGNVTLEGIVDEPATVTVDGVEAATHLDAPDRTSFWFDTTLPEGTHHLLVNAWTDDGRFSALFVLVIVDPTLEREFAYITEVDPEAETLTADYATWFTGEAANVAAQEDGVANDDGTVDGGFYIRNNNERLRTLPVAPGTYAILQACWPDGDGPCLTRQYVDMWTFAEFLDDPSVADTRGWHWYGDGQLPYWLTIDDGVVIQIDEQYLP